MPAAVSATRERGSGRERVLCNTLVLMEKPDQELWGGEQDPLCSAPRLMLAAPVSFGMLPGGS